MLRGSVGGGAANGDDDFDGERDGISRTLVHGVKIAEKFLLPRSGRN